MFANFGPGHWLVLGVVMVLMFAGSKLPEAARYGGKSLRILKSELQELHTDDRWPTNRSPRPPRSRWGAHRPCGSGVHPIQHRCLTVKAEPDVGQARGEHPTCHTLLAPRRLCDRRTGCRAGV